MTDFESMADYSCAGCCLVWLGHHECPTCGLTGLPVIGVPLEVANKMAEERTARRQDQRRATEATLAARLAERNEPTGRLCPRCLISLTFGDGPPCPNCVPQPLKEERT